VSFTSLKLSRSQSITATRLVGRRAACECVLDAIAEQHPVREAGEGVVEGVVDELDLVRPKSRDGVAHLAGEAQVLDEGENEAREHRSDDAQPCDRVEKVEVAGLGVL